ncbi:MAG: hypothetical protein U0931_01110 [Vulcanimicrobiota bacterium]
MPERLRGWAAGLEASFSNAENLLPSFARLLGEFKPDLLMVDSFPRGILGELAGLDFPCPACLVARWIKPAYALRPEVVEALERYQAVLGCELNPWGARTLGPVVGPLQSPSPCRWLWLGSGPLGPQRELAEVLGSRVRVVAPDLGQQSGTVSALLAGAELVISASGYNAYQEIVQAGPPVIFWPQDRLYDEQQRRARAELGPGPRAWWRCVHDLDGLERALLEFERERPQPAGQLTPASHWAQLLPSLAAGNFPAGGIEL